MLKYWNFIEMIFFIINLYNHLMNDENTNFGIKEIEKYFDKLSKI